MVTSAEAAPVVAVAAAVTTDQGSYLQLPAFTNV
jgi:hypothetical protein